MKMELFVFLRNLNPNSEAAFTSATSSGELP